MTLTASEGLTVKAGSGSPLSAGLGASERTLLLSSALHSQNGFIGPQWLTSLVDSGGQHSAMGATSAAHLQRLALR